MGTINANAPDSRQLLSSLVFIKPNGSFDAGGFAPGGVRVAGWTYYPYSGATAQVQITVDGNVMADVAANGARGDVAAVIPGAPTNAGFDAIVPVQNATSNVCINADLPNNSTLFPLGCKSVTVPTQPFGSLDVVANAGNSVRVAGWAVDPQTQGPLEIHVYVDGQIAGLVANRPRGDLAGRARRLGRESRVRRCDRRAFGPAQRVRLRDQCRPRQSRAVGLSQRGRARATRRATVRFVRHPHQRERRHQPCRVGHRPRHLRFHRRARLRRREARRRHSGQPHAW